MTIAFLVMLVALQAATAEPVNQGGAIAQTRPATQPAARSFVPVVPSWDRYDRLVRRNMFLRQSDRGAGSRGSDGDRSRTSFFSTTAPSTQPQSGGAWILTGTAVTDQSRIALLEHSVTGDVRRARVGDRAGGGRITKIEPTGVELETAGRLHSVTVGSSLDGSAMPTTMPSPGAPGAGAASNADSSSSESAGAAAALERMRARRRQEMNQ